MYMSLTNDEQSFEKKTKYRYLNLSINDRAVSSFAGYSFPNEDYV